jgi:hypothetical protein
MRLSADGSFPIANDLSQFLQIVFNSQMPKLAKNSRLWFSCTAFASDLHLT